LKKFKLITIVTIINFSGLIAQNYQSVNSNRITFFKNQSGNVNCIKVDSVKIQVDSVYYLFSNIQQLDYDCFTPYGDSWIGKEIIVGNKDYDYLFNRTHDTIKIKKSARLNENWVAYELLNSMKIIAEVIKYDTLSFLGLTDSVKTIGFQVYDASMSPISHDLNNMSIILSKNYGLIKTLNFYLFPEYTNGYLTDHQLMEYDLIGMTNPKFGIQNLEWFDVHDFQVGDEVHLLFKSSDIDEYHSFTETRKTIERYLKRTDFKDSILYIIERKQSKHVALNDSSSFQFVYDTINLVIKQNVFFNKLPGEPIFSSDVYSYFMTVNNFISKTEPSFAAKLRGQYNDTCWSNCCADGCYPAYEYVKGLGGPFYECSNAFSMGGMENKLVYYKKGQIIWGTPLIITGNSEVINENEIELYPNPAKEIIWIKIVTANLPSSIELMNNNGKVLMIKEINSELTCINLKKYTAGIYLFRIINKEKITLIKFIIN
jgi:hypothetical protein